MNVQLITTIKSRPLLSRVGIARIITTVCKAERASSDIVSVHIVGLTRMQTLNTLYRGVTRPTDVLAFEAGEPWGGEAELGDIFLCQPYIVRQAKRFDVSPKEEMTRMLVHGLLHLLGYDHETAPDAARMFDRQERYVSLHR